MSLRIVSNLEAATSNRSLRVSTDKLAISMRRLSSGLRINSAADDAAGLAISERMRSQIRGLEQANRNIQDGISLLNVVEGALGEVHSILQRARTLAVQWNNRMVDDYDAKDAIYAELVQLSNEVARIERDTMFNGIPVLQDVLTPLTLQIGANNADILAITLVDLFGGGLELVRDVTFGPLPWLPADVDGFDQHISQVASARSRMGAYINRLESTMRVNSLSQENLMQAESRIRDVDFAAEMTQFTRQQVLQSATTRIAMFANQNPKRLLDLLP